MKKKKKKKEMKVWVDKSQMKNRKKKATKSKLMEQLLKIIKKPPSKNLRTCKNQKIFIDIQD